MVNKFHFPNFGNSPKKQPELEEQQPIINRAVEDKNAALDDIYSFQNENQKKVTKVKK